MTPWTRASQAPLSMEFSRQESWSGLPSPSPGDLPDSGIEPRSPELQADSLLTEPPGKPKCWKKNNFLQLLKHLPITLFCDKLQTSKKAVEVYILQSNCPCLPKRSESKINGIWELHIIKFNLWGLKWWWFKRSKNKHDNVMMQRIIVSGLFVLPSCVCLFLGKHSFSLEFPVPIGK